VSEKSERDKLTQRYLSLKAMEEAPSAAENERNMAGRIRRAMEAKHPGIEAEASKLANGSASDLHAPGGSYDSGSFGGVYSARAQAQNAAFAAAQQAAHAAAGRSGWASKLGAFVRGALDEVTLGFALSELVNDVIDLEIDSNSRTVHIKVSLPIESAYEAAEMTGGSLDEYARLVGTKIGNELAAAFRASGY